MKLTKFETLSEKARKAQDAIRRHLEKRKEYSKLGEIMLLELGFNKYAALSDYVNEVQRIENASVAAGNPAGATFNKPFVGPPAPPSPAATTVAKPKPGFFKTTGKFISKHPGKAGLIAGGGLLAGGLIGSMFGSRE